MLADVRYALRSFARKPSYAVTAIATLALGITVNTVVFSLINSLLLRPMPVPDAGRVVRVYPIQPDGRRGNLFSYPDYLGYRESAAPFESLAAYIPAEITAGRSTLDRGVVEPRAALGYVVSANYFELTGVRAELGRVLQPDDDRRMPAVVVISHAFWQSRLSGDPQAVGATVTLNGTPVTVVGVARPGFAGTEPLVADCWISLAALRTTMAAGREPLDREVESLLVIGRLRPGATSAFAAEVLGVTARQLRAAYPGRTRPVSIDIARGTFFTIDPGLKPIIAGAMAVVGLVLLIACANAANLAIARAAARRREIALRLAIGAGRARIVRHLIVEALLIAAGAGVCALLAAEWTLRILYSKALSIAALPWAIALNLQPDVRVFVYTLAVALLSSVLLALLPALQASSRRLAGSLHGQPLLAGRLRGAALRHALVVAQVAASLILLFGAGLLLRALRTAEALDLGFSTSGVIYAEYNLRAAQYTEARAVAFNAALLESTAAIPGVAAAALTSHVPLHGGVRRSSVRLIGTTRLADSQAIVTTVSPDYFAALRIPFVEGHGFGSVADNSVPAAVISKGLANRFWPGEDAVGKAVSLAGSDGPRTVIGVVRDAANGAIWRDKELAVYLPVDASTDPRDLRLLVRTGTDPGPISKTIALRAASLSSDLRFSLVPLDELLRLWRLPSQVAAAAVGGLAALALILACVGLYGVLAFAVGERTRELGIRMALGADGRAVVMLILRDAARLVFIGLALGMGCALPAAPLLDRLLFGVSPFDLVTLVCVTAVVVVVALAASYAPARRAARLEPNVVLRME